MPGTPNSSACCNFYPRSPCGERRNDEAAAAVGGYFYPRSPCGERRANRRISDGENVISIHALLAESDQHPAGPAPLHRQFLSTLSLRRATASTRTRPPRRDISIHALLAESDWTAPCSPGGCGYFYPRSPCGERRYASAFPQSMQYFYPRSPCGERRVRQVILAEPFIFISIHALLAESDSRVFMLMPSMRYFYPRSPCGERLTVSTLKILAILFLSTLSLRRATTTSAGRSAFRRHFYPRSPCGERRVGPRWYSGVCNFYPRSPCGERLIPTLSSHAHPGISIHALLAESDPCSERQQVLPRRISIHALLAESDTSSGAAARPSGHFYPRSPCGERPQGHNPGSNKIDFYPRSPCGERLWAAKGRNGQKYFYPRSPCGERPPYFVLFHIHTDISIHALLAESDPYFHVQQTVRSLFLSTLSLRRATRESPWGWCIYQISIHALLAESDAIMHDIVFMPGYFYPRSPCGERHQSGHCAQSKLKISIHALLAESDF